MYLCSLIPRQTFWASGPLVETTVVHQWHSTILENGRILDECILTFKAGLESLTIKSKDLPETLRFWIPLLQCSIVTVRPVFRGTLSIRTFHCIRLGLNAVSSYTVRFLRSEAILDRTIKECDVLVEGPASLHAKFSIFSVKRKHVDEYYEALPIAFGAHLDVTSNSINDRASLPSTLDPIHIVCGHSSSAFVSKALSIAGGVPTLVLTKTPDLWTCLPNSVRTMHVSRSQLVPNGIFVVSEDELDKLFLDQEAEFDCFSKMISTTTNVVPNRIQVQRFLWNKFSTAFPSAKVCVANVQWPCVIEHLTMPSAEVRGLERHIVCVEQPCIKGRWPSFAFVANLYNISVEAARASACIWSQYLTCMDVPKSVLKTIKLRVEVVKPTLAEVRLSALGLACTESLLERMSPVVYGSLQMKKILMGIYDTQPISMARRLKADAAFTASIEYVVSQLTASTCCVCFEEDKTEKTMSLCGHTFCKDCSIVVFAEPVRNPKSIVSCPYCRSELACGDFFSVNDKEDAVTIKRSKSFPAKCIPVDELGVLGPAKLLPSEIPEKSTIVVASLKNCGKFVSALLSTKHQNKVTALTSGNEPWVEELQDLLK